MDKLYRVDFNKAEVDALIFEMRLLLENITETYERHGAEVPDERPRLLDILAKLDKCIAARDV